MKKIVTLFIDGTARTFDVKFKTKELRVGLVSVEQFVELEAKDQDSGEFFDLDDGSAITDEIMLEIRNGF